jgi:hypothetical protein
VRSCLKKKKKKGWDGDIAQALGSTPSTTEGGDLEKLRQEDHLCPGVKTTSKVIIIINE